LGEVCLDKLYGNERLALKSDGREIPIAIIEAVQKIKPCYSAKLTSQDILLIPRELQHLPVNSFCMWNQEIYQREQNKLTHIPKGERIQANLEILDIIEELLIDNSIKPMTH
jgi:hypothetical protein